MLWLWFCAAAAFGLVGGCSREYNKADADKEVYKIIDSKWHDSFGQKANYIISDSNIPPSPNDVQFRENELSLGVLSLAEAVAIATANNRGYQAQKESLYTKALNLTSERHKYALQWFGTIDGSYELDKSTGSEDVSVGTGGGKQGELGAGVSKSHLLASGIQISTSLAINWLRYLTGDPRMSLGSVLRTSVTVPLLGAGAGRRARENLTLAERNVLYQIRSFNRFRKTFVVTIIDRYYNVLQQRDAVINAKNNWERKIDSRKRLEMEAETGRKTQFDVDEARQSELNARNNHVRAQRSYEDALDNFKVDQLSVSTDANIVLDQSELKVLEDIGISQPDYMLEEAIETALLRRLDLANSADAVDDSVRNLILVADGLGPQLNLTGGLGVSSREETDFSQLQFHQGTYTAGLDADLPFDRKTERNNYRSALISLEQQQRQYDKARDDVELGVRSRYRLMLERAESYRIQRMSLDLAQRRVENNELLLNAGRGTVRVLLESQDALLNAQDSVTTALINHLIAKLNFFTDVGILQVRPDGMWEQRTL